MLTTQNNKFDDNITCNILDYCLYDSDMREWYK